MSEGMRIQRRRNIMVFTNIAESAPYKRAAFQSYDLFSAYREGEVEAGLPEPIPVTTPPTYNLSDELFTSLNLVLNYAAANNLGPTRSSRQYYLWFFSLAAAYQWVQTEKRITGTKDGWDWNTQYPITSTVDLCVWMLSALEVINGKFPISYNASWGALATAYSLTGEQLEAKKTAVKVTSRFSVWNSAYGTWWTARAADGSVAAAVPPTDSELPNGATRLDVAATVDPATFPSPESWTPLKIGTASQRYLTYNWNSVSSPSLTAANQTTIYAAANAYYPSSGDRVTEIGEVVSIANTLNDTQKVIAEFWAGGPFTVSPPGMLLWIWKTYAQAKSADPTLFVFSGLDLTLHLFETGRIVWGLKKAHMEARPIQEIRRLYRGQNVKKYDGTNILGESWMPYQETDFVTPPFADFPSGHSAFSRSFSNVMNDWFGASIDTNLVVSMSDISLLSPALVAQVGPMGSFVFNAGASLIQQNIVPASAITLSWSTWADMAESAGISRKYGGIHATSAHTGSVAAADSLHSAINTNFPIART
jgi:hypothetical protein